MNRTINIAPGIEMFAYPHPYKAWLCISNDPDNTNLDNWRQLDAFIWKELKLPFGDAIFLKSFNQNLPDQVSFESNKEILTAHPHDSLHFWGDYQHARKRAFDRTDAEEAAKTLKQNNFTPRVWVDHSNSRANFIHASTEGSRPVVKDSSGVEYTNFMYSLDIAYNCGIRYIWYGDITPHIGQDTEFSYTEYLKSHEVSSAKRSFYSLLKPVLKGPRLKKLIPAVKHNNQQIWPHRFPDGRTLYCFNRYGTWPDADIDGLALVISSEQINDLLNRQGTCVVYTHLGKRKPNRNNEAEHIPPATKKALQNLADLYRQKQLMLSPISSLLDYLVLRNNVTYNTGLNQLEFKSDGIRFEKLTQEDLKAHTFSFYAGKAFAGVKTVVDGNAITSQVKETEPGIYSVTFA